MKAAPENGGSPGEWRQPQRMEAASPGEWRQPRPQCQAHAQPLSFTPSSPMISGWSLVGKATDNPALP